MTTVVPENKPVPLPNPAPIVEPKPELKQEEPKPEPKPELKPEPVPQPIVHEEPPFDEASYLKMFETMEEKHKVLADIVSVLHLQPDQDHRLAKVMEYVVAHQAFARQTCDLIVELHNFVVSGHNLLK